MPGGMSVAERRAALEHARDALVGLDAELWQVQGPELGPLLELIDGLGQRVEGAKVALLAEATERGETAGRMHDWLLRWAPSYHAGGSARVVAVVEGTRADRYASLRRAVLDGRAPVVNAACVVQEFERIGHRLHPEAHEPVMQALVELAEEGRCRDIRRIRQHLIARYGRPGELQADQDKAREQRSMSQPLGDGGGLYDYHLVVDEEAKALVEAAVGPLSAPRPAEGVPDRRPSGQRRLDALVEVVRRGVASASGVATTTKAQLFVTMDLDDLTARAGAGTVLGTTSAGALLAPETVRRLACDSGIVPMVLGSAGEVLEMGRRVRLFTEGQLRALWVRDRGCSMPGCTVPSAWCDAHHLWHFADGGPTDLDNAALLCGRHHDLVHARAYHGVVSGGHVEWQLQPGAYDYWLRQRDAAAADAKAVRRDVTDVDPPDAEQHGDRCGAHPPSGEPPDEPDEAPPRGDTARGDPAEGELAQVDPAEGDPAEGDPAVRHPAVRDPAEGDPAAELGPRTADPPPPRHYDVWGLPVTESGTPPNPPWPL